VGLVGYLKRNIMMDVQIEMKRPWICSPTIMACREKEESG